MISSGPKRTKVNFHDIIIRITNAVRKVVIIRMIEVDESGNNVWEYTYSTDQIDDYWIARANKYSVEYF